jgi:hypothetical protein
MSNVQPGDDNGSGAVERIAAKSWPEQLRLARARALAAGATVHWDRLDVSEEEQEATLRLRERLASEQG